MNPYEQKFRDLSNKSHEWRNGEGKGKRDIYITEIAQTMFKIQEWDDNRPFEIRLTNNPWIKEIEVNMNHDFKFILHPRVKLVYNFISLKIEGMKTDPTCYSRFLRDIFASPTYTVRPAYVDKIDIRARLFHDKYYPVVLDDKEEKRKLTPRHVADVSVFFRDLSFITPPTENKIQNNPQDDLYSKIEAGREFLLSQKLAKFRFHPFRLPGHEFELRATVPDSEDPYVLLAQFSAVHPGYMEHSRPLIILHNLVSKWFVQPNSCEPTEELLTTFLSYFGLIRYLDVSKDKLNGELCSASVQYFDHDDFFNALKILCCCSLRQEHSPELIDYEVSLGTVPSGLQLALRKSDKKILSGTVDCQNL